MDESQFKHLAIVLSNINDATIDWAEVAKTRGIGRKDNAATAFKTMMKKLGVEYADKKFVLTDSATASTTTSETKTKASTPRKRKAKSGEDDADGAKADSPKKKSKAKEVVEAKEMSGDDEEA